MHKKKKRFDNQNAICTETKLQGYELYSRPYTCTAKNIFGTIQSEGLNYQKQQL